MASISPLLTIEAHRVSKRGAVAKPSPFIVAQYREDAFVLGAWHVYADGESWRFDDGWIQIAKGPAAGGFVGALVGATDRLFALCANELGVFELKGVHWEKTHAATPAFHNNGNRMQFAAGYDARRERVVVWGRRNYRYGHLNDTLVLDPDGFRALKSRSPPPKDRDRGGPYPLVFDFGLQRLVRFGVDEIASLEDDDVWHAFKPRGYAALKYDRAQHTPLDPFNDPVSGETLLFDERRGLLSRFDLEGCERIAALAHPWAPDWVATGYVHRCYDPAGRTLHVQLRNDVSVRWWLDLTPAFEAARNLGPRTLVAAGPSRKGKTPA